MGFGAPVLSPSGREVAATSTDENTDGVAVTSVVVAGTDGRRAHRVPRLRLVDAVNIALAWTPDGRSIAVGQGSGQGVALVDVHTGGRRALLRGPASHVAFAPNGKSYAFNAPGGVWVGDTRSGRTTRIVDEGADPAWSPDSRHVAYFSTRDRNGSYGVHEGPAQTAREVYVADGAGHNQRRVTHTTKDEAGPLIWTRDGRALLYSRRTPTGSTTLALDVARGCSAPATLPRAGLPQGDPGAWDYSGTSGVLHLAC